VKITACEAWREAVPLTRPYEISYRRIDAVELHFLRLETDEGHVGLGSASPAESVTGESSDACEAALAGEHLDRLVGLDPLAPDPALDALGRSHRATPAARAAVDMALHDLHARARGLPVVELFGRCHDALPTSVTIGITSIETTLAEAEEHTGHGFRCLKIKTGRSFEEDEERLARLRERVGAEVRIRIDANQGCTPGEAVRLGTLARRFDLELVEQPLPAGALAAARDLPDELRRIVAADESLHDDDDARTLAAEPMACGIFNIKLMKCGGIRPARAIASVAEGAGIDLMWGCNDESVISLAAALHAAYACPRTRYLDLDGAFDLARDPARGGFVVEAGCLRLLDRPGLGVELEPRRNEAGS
jgi:L-alanine-DL-glutamate epimerase-like enolase superfamily enzyme